MAKKLLTPSELKAMQVLWEIERGFIKDILAHWELEAGEEMPAYNTISTIVRILEKKGFVSHKAYGRTHEYYPLISRGAYRKRFLREALNEVFEGSVRDLLSALVDDKKVDKQELEALQRLIDEHE